VTVSTDLGSMLVVFEVYIEVINYFLFKWRAEYVFFSEYPLTRLSHEEMFDIYLMRPVRVQFLNEIINDPSAV
jgi:hypothetical protein